MDDGSSRVGPDISAVAALLAEPARARMLGALMGGTALTATELSLHAGVTASTASSHLGKLVDARILKVARQGRHRYFHLFDDEVASLLEALAQFASRDAPRRPRVDPALAAARVCYDHLAGAAGVWLSDRLRAAGLVAGRDAFAITSSGTLFFTRWGIDVETLARARRPLCRACLDWSERRFHLGGSLGAAILARLFELGWARRERDGRAVAFTPRGERSFHDLFEARLAGSNGSPP